MAYSASPIDFDAGLACNGNNLSFYLGHLRRFAQDTSLVALSDALMHGNVSQAFLLAVTCVYLPAAELCDLLRDGKAENLPQAQDVFLELLAGFEEAKMEVERY